MRVRMLQTHETPAMHPKLGALTLRYPAGSTQHFDDATGARLLAEKKAEPQPESGGRVTMRRTVEEDGVRYAKGAVWHVGPEQLARWLGDADPIATLTPDEGADFISATRDAALAEATARAEEEIVAQAKRAEIKARMQSATNATNASSASSAKKQTSASASAAPSTPTADAPKEG